MTYFTGIDIGSTASKVVVLDSEKMVANFVIPTGWNSKDTARAIASKLADMGYPVDDEMKVIATGYGRISVDYASKVVTEKLDKAYLNIETDYSQSDKGQINTRLAAFLETIDR